MPKLIVNSKTIIHNYLLLIEPLCGSNLFFFVYSLMLRIRLFKFDCSAVIKGYKSEGLEYE